MRRKVFKTAAWSRKAGKDPRGGLNALGRASARAQGMKLRAPVSARQAKGSKSKATRRRSFCRRMGAMQGALRDANGRPTRKYLALRRWDCHKKY